MSIILGSIIDILLCSKHLFAAILSLFGKLDLSSGTNPCCIHGSSTHYTIESHSKDILSTWIETSDSIHGLVVHSAQPGDGGVQLTEVVMSLGTLGWVQCRVTVLHDSSFATTLAGARGPVDSRSHDNTLSL